MRTEYLSGEHLLPDTVRHTELGRIPRGQVFERVPRLRGKNCAVDPVFEKQDGGAGAGMGWASSLDCPAVALRRGVRLLTGLLYVLYTPRGYILMMFCGFIF